MRSIITLFIIPFFVFFSVRILTGQDKQTLKSPSEYFPVEKAQVLVVGTFHFHYPGLDIVNVDEENKIDVLKDPKKAEVTELVNYIKKFNPNKIAIEALDDWNAVDKLRKYNEGEYRDKRDERFQIAIRLASELDLDTLYSIDASSIINDMEKTDSAYVNNLFTDYDFKSDDPYNQLYMEYVSAQENLIPRSNLLEYFKHTNSEESHQYGYGVYLSGDFKLDSNRGADILSMWWYNRNLRIFRNLQKITEGSNDRILVVIGNGHAAVLRQLLEASPEYEFIEFDSLE